ncbi:uncharacterized protein B0H18DRAFT_566750 [Fomitopsis serialis]|uniref:uncharacterized protein n=1 Tax=Fomitopsis serialis TaxID=139415 RepID=UPI002008919C|nr:uncharacterized protein B0H18DRAFT_566750 [Neoantrodia serialis]KAH9921329.1 hypothetical protein B0H18DRAFT_566750 [Neoantrodia serialis]
MGSVPTPSRQRIQSVLKFTGQQDALASHHLPDLESVRQDIALMDSIQMLVEQTPTILLHNPRPGGPLGDPAPRSLIFNSQLSQLFNYSFLIHVDDVPADILKPVVWALQMFVDVLTEATDAQLLAFGHVLSPEDAAAANRVGQAGALVINSGRLFMRLQAKAKLAIFLLRPEINRPGDAVISLRELMEYFVSRTPIGQLRQQHNLVMIFAEALVRSGEDDAKAETLLTELTDSPASDAHGLEDLVVTKVYLSRILRRRGNVGAAKRQEKWLVKWFRKNPHGLSDTILRQLLIPTGETTSPILEALGGISWLEGREHTDKTDRRLVKRCRQCLRQEPIVKLFLCSQCKTANYWYVTLLIPSMVGDSMRWVSSRECQKKDWPLHKHACKGLAAVNNQAASEQLSPDPANPPVVTQRQRDWVARHHSAEDSWPYVSALRLHENPSRGQTHLIIEQSVYTPDAGPLAKDKFTIVGCAVFRVSDIVSDIELSLKLSPGEGAQLCERALRGQRQSEPGNPLIPFLILRVCEGVDMTVGTGLVESDQLQQTQYNRNWRQEISKTSPPQKLMYRNRRDAEFD